MKYFFLILCEITMAIFCSAQEQPRVAMTVLRGDSNTYLVFCNMSELRIKVPYALLDMEMSDPGAHEKIVRIDTTIAGFRKPRTKRPLVADSIGYMMIVLKPKECYSIPLKNCDPRSPTMDFTVAAGQYEERIRLNVMSIVDNPFFVQKAEP